MSTFKNFINGQFVEAADGQTTAVIDPSTGEVYAQASLSGAADVDTAMKAAGKAFTSWSQTTPSERSLALYRIADAIEARADEIVAAEVKNTGKPIALTASEEIPPMVDQIRFFAGAARMLEGKATAEYMANMTSMIRREPVGVCAQVAPWNYPMMMAVWKFAPAIAAGNTVVLKPSDTTPASTTLLAEIAAEFLPPGVLNVICGDRDTGRAMVTHDIPSMVSVTGSVRAGMEVAEAAAKSLKRVHLELGGKAPVIVFDDADLDTAVSHIAMTGYFNAGQDCTAAARVLVARSIYDAFVLRLVDAARATRYGDPDSQDALYGPLNNAGQLARVQGYIDRLPAHATIEIGGRHVDQPGYYFEPTVITGLKQHDEAIQNEIFGPVITVQAFDSEQEAVALANGVEYGLAASVWTRDHARATRLSRELDFGTVWINTYKQFSVSTPFGGVKDSGTGREGGRHSLEFYSEWKNVTTAF